MGWIEGKSVWLGCPYFADVFEGCEALEGLQPPPVIVGVDEVVEMCSELRVAVIMVSFDGSLLDRPVHPFDLPIGPGMLDLGEPVFDPVLFAPHVEHVGYPSRCGAVGVAWREGKLDAIIGQHGVDFVWHGFDQGDQEGRGCHPVRLGHELDEGELAGAVDAHIQVQLAFSGADFGVFNRIFVELAGKAGEPDRIMIDATHLKAHRTAASLLKGGLFPDVSGAPKAA